MPAGAGGGLEKKALAALWKRLALPRGQPSLASSHRTPAVPRSAWLNLGCLDGQDENRGSRFQDCSHAKAVQGVDLSSQPYERIPSSADLRLCLDPRPSSSPGVPAPGREEESLAAGVGRWWVSRLRCAESSASGSYTEQSSQVGCWPRPRMLVCAGVSKYGGKGCGQSGPM